MKLETVEVRKKYSRAYEEYRQVFDRMLPGQSFLVEQENVNLLRIYAKKHAELNKDFDWDMDRESPSHFRFVRLKIHQ